MCDCVLCGQGKTYSIWKLSDLQEADITVSFFLFGQVYKQLWKMDVGCVIGLLNPGIMDPAEKVARQNNSSTSRRLCGWVEGRGGHWSVKSIVMDPIEKVVRQNDSSTSRCVCRWVDGGGDVGLIGLFTPSVKDPVESLLNHCCSRMSRYVWEWENVFARD